MSKSIDLTNSTNTTNIQRGSTKKQPSKKMEHQSFIFDANTCLSPKNLDEEEATAIFKNFNFSPKKVIVSDDFKLKRKTIHPQSSR